MTHDQLVLKVKDLVDDYEHFLNSDPYQLYEAIAEMVEVRNKQNLTEHIAQYISQSNEEMPSAVRYVEEIIMPKIESIKEALHE